MKHLEKLYEVLMLSQQNNLAASDPFLFQQPLALSVRHLLGIMTSFFYAILSPQVTCSLFSSKQQLALKGLKP